MNRSNETKTIHTICTRAGAPLIAALTTLIFSSTASAEWEVIIDFESVPHGSSVEGLGTVHDLLDIYAGGSGVVLGEGIAPATYGAGGAVENGCLGNPGGYAYGELSEYGQGFADLDRFHDYLFSFSPGTTVSQFSVAMLDFGDYNPTLSAHHEVRLTAYDANGALVDEDVLSYQSTPKTNPPEYKSSGDACTAQAGQPGNYTFEVVGPGITWVVLEITAGIDPNIAFDNIAFTACEDLDGDAVCDDCDVCPDTVIPETPPSVELKPNHYALIDDDGVFDTRLPNGTISASGYTLADTHGCSCEQIIEICGVGEGHAKHGCSEGIIESAIAGACFDAQCTPP
jgi:hypothetical protein